MKFTFKHSRKGFTLLELMIALTIFAIMSSMTILIYFNVSENARRLQISREISETARNITEKIDEAVKKYGIDTKVKYDSSPGDKWKENNHLSNYGGIWSIVLPLKTEEKTEIDSSWRKNSLKINRFFVYGQKSDNTMSTCEPGQINNLQYHCGLYFVTKTSGESDNIVNLVDAFMPEDKKRVRITDLKFYISGGDDDAKKVTLKMTLELMARGGVPPSLVRASKMELQTTFSERIYK